MNLCCSIQQLVSLLHPYLTSNGCTTKYIDYLSNNIYQNLKKNALQYILIQTNLETFRLYALPSIIEKEIYGIRLGV